MYLHQLTPEKRDRVVHNERTGHTLVLTPQGAVFYNEFTEDLSNICIAFGELFSDDWRPADYGEIEAMRNRQDDRLMSVQFCQPPAPRPRSFTVIFGGKGENPCVVADDGVTKLYDLDDIK